MSRYKIKVESGDAYLVPGDLHFGAEAPGPIKAMDDFFANRYKKHRKGVLCLGDAVDSHTITRHKKRAQRLAELPTLMDEVALARPWFERASKYPLGCTYVLGNHEYWIQDIVDDEPGLAGAPGMEWGALTGLGDIDGLEILPYQTWVDLGDNVSAHHGKGLPSSIKQVTLKYPDQFTVYGHYHSVELRYRTVYTKDGPVYRGAMQVGCMQGDPDYTVDPDWQWGFGVIEFFGDKGDGDPLFKPTPYVVVKNKKGEYVVA